MIQLLAQFLVTTMGVILAGTQIEDRATAIAPVTVEVISEPQKLRVGDPLTITLVIQSQPDIEVMLPETSDNLGEFRVVGKTTTRERTANDWLVTRLSFVLDVSLPGELVFPSLRIGYVDYRSTTEPMEKLPRHEISTTPYSVVVDSVLPPEGLSELHGPLKEVPQSGEEGRSRDLWILGTLIAVIGLAVGYGWWRRSFRRNALTEKSPAAVAREALDQLEKELLSENDIMSSYCSRLSSILRNYLESALALPAITHTADELDAPLPGAPANTRPLPIEFRSLLHELDALRFAPQVPTSTDIQLLLQRAKVLFNKEAGE